jgi:uncharacterized protein YjbI with pentapeptide repeats
MLHNPFGKEGEQLMKAETGPLPADEPEPRWDRRLWAVIAALPYLIPVGLLLVLAAIITLVAVGAYTYGWEWTGFLGKTLWDWMKLLVVPLILALGGLLITQMERLNAARSQQLDRERLELDRRLAEERQITDLFTRTIDQLGATDDSGNRILEVRVAAIYALERIARDSPRDHWSIMEILTSYVRQHAPWQPEEGPQGGEDATIEKPKQDSARFRGEFALTEAPAPAPDILAIITVIRRRTRYYGRGEPEPLDLHQTNLAGVPFVTRTEKVNLRGAILTEANLRRADLSGADLWAAFLAGAYLSGTFLRSANLQWVQLREANLSGAALEEADLGKADLSGANLEGAVLRGANLAEVNLEGAVLRGANLAEANLVGSNLLEANLEGAYLADVDLTGATLANVMGVNAAQLEQQAASLEGATMPDGSIHP